MDRGPKMPFAVRKFAVAATLALVFAAAAAHAETHPCANDAVAKATALLRFQVKSRRAIRSTSRRTSKCLPR
jgi:hypothetical protein